MMSAGEIKKSFLATENSKIGDAEINAETLAAEDFFTEKFRQIVARVVRWRLSHAQLAEAPVIENSALIRVWKWLKNRSAAERAALSDVDAERVTRRIALNEVYRFYEQRRAGKFDSLEDFAESEIAALHIDESVIGSANSEIVSIARFFWTEIKKISFRQRAAILLGDESEVCETAHIGSSMNLICLLLAERLTTSDELAEILCCSRERLREIISEMPLSDRQIALFYAEVEKSDEPCAEKTVKDARHKGRLKLRHLRDLFEKK